MKFRTVPIGIFWCPRWDKEDALFYIGRSWECSVWLFDKSKRIEIYSTRIQLGPVRIRLGYLPSFETYSQLRSNK